MADKLKLIIAVVLAVAALAGFYAFDEQQQVVRVLGLLIGLAGAAFVASRSEAGANVVAFGRGAIVEVRKVVWPTRQETTQTTIVVLVVVFVVALILWLLDWGLNGIVSVIIG